MNPADALDKVKAIVTGSRNETHGDFKVCLSTTAKFWSLYLHSLGRTQLTGADVCRLMELLKMSRILSGQADPDHNLDRIGYAAIAAALEE